MEPSERDQDLTLVRRLRRCGHLLHHKYNFTNGSQMRLLLRLRDEPMTQKELTEKLRIQPGSLSEMLTKVERAGLVEKRRCERDRRNFELRLTDEGRAQADVFEKEQMEQATWLLEPLTDDQKAQLKSLLETLIAHWEPENRTEQTDKEKE
ncbi:MAG: MarR family winged helix-turn-helix transcriptional regulator [Candidatus Spyradocola sp.]